MANDVKTPGGAEDVEAAPTTGDPDDAEDGSGSGSGGPGGPGSSGDPDDALRVRDRARYDVLGEHGRGGLGKVARAYDKDLGRQVAIKELIRRGNTGEARFLREALITARLEHPNIVPIHEAGRWPDGTPFYVMKLVSGRPLKDLIEERTSVAERLELLHHVLAVADAMAYAHERRIIHRDLKPANVIAGEFGETIVIDWGLAKDLSASGAEPPPVPAPAPAPTPGPRTDPAHAELTEAGGVLGTPMYMPPEQWRGAAVDERADVFAIGAMLWELCSLQRVPPSDARLRDRMLRRAGIDQDLATIIAKALAPDPADRYRDAGELARDLKAFKSGARIAARAYSPLAVLAHWTRRHRALTTTIAAATLLALGGGVLYVRNITIERDRADAALTVAETQRAIASTERDNARLSEATAVLEKDPTRARELLAKLPLQTPRAALLRARARHGAALRVVPVPAAIDKLRRHPATGSIAVVTARGELALLDVDRGQLLGVDRDLQRPLTWRADHWIYARKPFGAKTVTVTSTTSPPQTIDVGPLLAAPTSTLVAAAGRTYAVDGGDLYALEDRGAKLIRRGVRSVAGNERLLLVCTAAGELEVARDGAVERRTRCAQNPSTWPMVAVGGDYAALLDPTTLLLVRGGQPLELPTRVEGEYELALSGSGLLAVADFADKTWFVRPGGTTLELGPSHSARPMSVAVAGRLAAWGYTDGVVIALDTQSGTVWKFSGHTFSATYVALDERNARLVSASRTEIRVWPLSPDPLAPMSRMPCTVYHVVRSPDRSRALLDCDDGIARTWHLASGQLRDLHRHYDISRGAAWLRDTACSAGLDRRVICTDPDGTSRDILSDAGVIRQMISNPARDRIIISTEEGQVREFDGVLRSLFVQRSQPSEMAISADGRWLASGTVDGSVSVWDFSKRRVSSETKAHADVITGLRWRDGELWTISADRTLKRWRNDAGALGLLETQRETGALRLLQLLPNGWVAIAGRELIIAQAPPAAMLRLELDRYPQRIEISDDRRYVAAAIPGEIVIVDRTMSSIATLPVAFSGIGYAGFLGSEALIISKADGLFKASLSSLVFEKFTVQ